MSAEPTSDDAEISRLKAEIDAVSAELKVLPLINDNKKIRLALNQRKLDAEAALARIHADRERAAKRARLEAMNAELRTLDDTPAGRLRRAELKRAIAELRVELG